MGLKHSKTRAGSRPTSAEAKGSSPKDAKRPVSPAHTGRSPRSKAVRRSLDSDHARSPCAKHVEADYDIEERVLGYPIWRRPSRSRKGGGAFFLLGAATTESCASA